MSFLSFQEAASKIFDPVLIAEGKAFLSKPVSNTQEFLPFTRAGGGSTTIQNGKIVEQAENVPAIVKRVGECARMAFRPARTRIIAYPETIENAAWSKLTQGTGIIPIATDNYGTYQGRPTTRLQFEVTTLDDNSRSYVQANAASNNGVQSVFIRSLSGANVTLTVLGIGANDTIVTTEWTKVELAVTAATALRIGIIDVGSTSPSLSADVEIAMCSWESSGTYSTDFISGNDSGTQTRNADSITKTGLKAAGYIGASMGTIGGKFSAKSVIAESNGFMFSFGSGGGDYVSLRRLGGASASRVSIVVGAGGFGISLNLTTQDENAWIYGWSQEPDVNGDRWYLSINGVKVASGSEAFTYPSDNTTFTGANGLWELITQNWATFKLPVENANLYTATF